MLFGFFCGCRGFCQRTESDLFLFLFLSESEFSLLGRLFHNTLYFKELAKFDYILTSNENATPKCSSIYHGYIIYILSQGIFGDFMNTKDRHDIGFISFNVKCPNVDTHAHFPTVV